MSPVACGDREDFCAVFALLLCRKQSKSAKTAQEKPLAVEGWYW
jgi:hypothetical protein